MKTYTFLNPTLFILALMTLVFFRAASPSTLAQDDQGSLWFATGDGLSHYDGYSFRIYRFERSNANSLSNNSMTAIHPGRGGVLWLATTGYTDQVCDLVDQIRAHDAAVADPLARLADDFEYARIVTLIQGTGEI